jgi:hypothetical protein
MRGHSVEAAVKCLVLIVKMGKKTSRFVLAVVPDNARVDTAKIRSVFSPTPMREKLDAYLRLVRFRGCKLQRKAEVFEEVLLHELLRFLESTAGAGAMAADCVCTL